jgi:flavin-dependent dehydrogenase
MRKENLIQLKRDSRLSSKQVTDQLTDGSRVAVMGGGPSGSLFAYYLLELAERIDLELNVDIYEPRDFSRVGPPGCNMCAGIISESLIQALAVDGINLPSTVIQRGINSYVLHNELGKTCLDTPFLEKRIGVVFRGSGPRDGKDREWQSFDGFLLDRAVEKGASVIHKRVTGVERVEGGLMIGCRDADPQKYDFLAVATGVNTNAIRLFEALESGYQSPRVAQAFIREYYLGEEKAEGTFGNTVHFFLLNLPGLEFAAAVPKGSYVTICLLGGGLSQELLETFLQTPQVKSCMPPGWSPEEFVCHCSPRINISGAIQPFADRMVFLGDIGVSRLYKDGIGAAYRAAKAAASAAVFEGVGEDDLRKYYGRASRRLERDNLIGKAIFAFVGMVIKPRRFMSRAMLRMVASEQSKPAAQQRMSSITWDIFTGSAPYADIALRILHPFFLSKFLWFAATSLIGGQGEG